MWTKEQLEKLTAGEFPKDSNPPGIQLICSLLAQLILEVRNLPQSDQSIFDKVFGKR